MSQFDTRSSRRHDPSLPALEDDHALSNIGPESSAEVGNLDLTSALMNGPMDAFHGLAAGTTSLAAQGIDVSPVMTSLALRRRAMLRADIAADTSSVDRVMTRSGSALPNALRGRMEASFQHMFGHVRVHTDAAAEQAAKDLNAHAFAVGSHIYFGSGTWRPGSTETDRLLAHELTHVVQHDEGRINGSGVSSPTDPLEREAYANEDRIVGQLSELDRTPEPDSGNGWMDASLALGPVPDAVENARDGGGHAQEEAGNALNEQAASLGAGAFGMGGMALRKEGTTEAPEAGPKAHDVGDEVYARSGENARRGVVVEVREWADGDGGAQVAPADGWTYVVNFERSDGTTQDEFISENLRAAKVQSVPEATLPEASGDEVVEDQVCESEDEVETKEETTESSVETTESNGPVSEIPAVATSPGTDSVSLPPLGPVIGPVLTSTTAVRSGQVAPISMSSSIPESSELNTTHQRVVQSLNTQLGVGEGIFNTAAGEVESLCIDASSSFGVSETGLRTNFVTSNTQGLQSLSSDVDSTLATTGTAYDAFDLAVDQSASELGTLLTTQAQTTETSILQSKADFPLVIKRAIEAHKIVMEGEFGAVIGDITAQAAEEKAAAELEGKTYGGGATKADEVAGKLNAAKVKENYAKALRTFLDAVYEDLLSKGGMPAEEWAQSIHAPALAAVWPGMARHQQQVDEKKNRDKAAAAAGRKNFENVVSLDRTVVADQTASHQEDVGATQDQANQDLNQCVQEVSEENQAFTEVVSSGLQERQQDERDALASVAPDDSTGVDTSMWDMYVAKYEFRSKSEHELVLQQTQSLTQQNVSAVQSMFDGTLSSIENHSQEEQLASQEHQTAFQTNVQQTASEQVVGLQTSATDVQAQHIQTATAAQEQSNTMLEGIGGAARTFLDTTVQPALDGYAVSTRQRMGTLLGKMEEALKGAAKAGAALEKADRSKRASNVWAAADYMWGTDEAKMMSAVSGTSPLQASALCEEYQHQQGHSLKYVIEDETSGSLKKSLLAWIFGDEVAAAKHAMDYGSNAWFPDSAVLDPALRGVSDEGRAALAVDPEWQDKSVVSSIFNPTSDIDTMLSLTSLADMSLSKDEAGLRADAALLFQTMDTWTGTDEAGAFVLLEKYGPEKAAELRVAYARYSYDRLNGWGRFDALSAEDQQAQADTSLVNDINGDFCAYDSEGENDRALALSQGNMGAARAAQLKDSAEWSNDPTAALGAVGDAKMYQGDDWLQGVQATENHAVFMQSMGVYESGGHMDVQDMRDGNSLESRQSAVDGWDANEKATQSWITDEFSGGDTVEAMLQEKLTTGEADEGDMLMYGADTLGTRETWVKMALDQVKAQKDYYTRLDMLVNLGGRAAEYQQSNLDAYQRNVFGRQVPGQMARLPAYLGALEPSLAASLTSAIRNILVCLNAEADGGTQFDWELLLGESLRRDKNALDMWQMADQKFRNMLPEHVRTRATNNADLQVWLDQTNASVTASVAEQRERYESGVAESDEGQITETDVMLAGHIIKLQRMFDEGSAKHFDPTTGFLYAHANADKAAAAEAWWTEFEAQCARVDTATAFEEASQNQLAAMATMIVTAIAGVIIAIVSFGAATAVSAALWSAGITLAAGLVNIAINFAIKGSRYGAEDMLVDLAKTLTDAALQFATLGMSRLATVGPWLKAVSAGDDIFLKLAAAAVTSLPGEMNGLLFNEDVWRGDNLDMALRQFFVGIAKNSVTGVVADYGKSGFSEVTEANGLAGMYLEGAIDELTALAGDALTNPAALQNPAYWINMTTKLGFGTLGGHIAQGRAVRLMNDQDFGDLNVEHLGRLHPGALADLSEGHRAEIGRRATNGDPDFIPLLNKLMNAGGVVVESVAESADESVDQVLPELGTSTLIEEPGTATTTVRTDDEIDTEVLDRLIDYADGGETASMITEYVLNLETAEERLNAVNTLQEAYALQTTTHVTEMSPSDLETLVQSHMMFDDAFQQSEVLRKVVPEDDMMGLWVDYSGNESRTPVMGGSVGPAENTDGLNAPETVSALGLDYRQQNPDRPSPYVTEVDGRYKSVESILYTDTPLTDDMKSSAKIPVDQSIIDYALAHDDPIVRTFAESRYTTGQETQEAPIGGLQTSHNPFTGNGMTMPTSWLDNPTVVPNQEYTMGYTGVAPGTQWYGLDDRGNRVVVLTYNGPANMAHAPYTLSESIPPGSALEAQVNRILLSAEEATGQDPLRHYDR